MILDESSIPIFNQPKNINSYILKFWKKDIDKLELENVTHINSMDAVRNLEQFLKLIKKILTVLQILYQFQEDDFESVPLIKTFKQIKVDFDLKLHPQKRKKTKISAPKTLFGFLT